MDQGIESSKAEFWFIVSAPFLHNPSSLVQHAQIKDELISQGVIPLLIRCATETKYDVIKVQQRALEILWALTFNEQTATILETDQIFMKHIKTLRLSDEKGVQKQLKALFGNWRKKLNL
ncbi:unnamed protein product [Didymodactylos carnosus]|uniref:Uncharacterized protein n=1 Tax=Didymodactylos carnosus TaxID=1234261 RepID=A0A815E6D8_9BILA|nr:unnamed protein product [Didymodactylos carnosus]CAF4141937.1 unnamed protein product [Didymodactylos carnosus]